jgi:hypothetical protein
LRGLSDRRKLRVEGSIVEIIPSEEPEELRFSITMTNIGRRPIFISTCGLIPKKKKGIKGKIRSLYRARELPKMLKEGEYHIEVVDDYTLGGREIIGIYARDSSGKEWRASKKNIKMVIKQLNECRSEKPKIS